jgi:hypothetical protein
MEDIHFIIGPNTSRQNKADDGNCDANSPYDCRDPMENIIR